MERNEMINVLMEKANVNYDEAKAALELNNWDLLDSIIYLERNGKVENNETTTIVEFKEAKKEESKDEYGGVGEIVGRVFKFFGNILKHGNENYFEVRKDNEKPIRISLTIWVLLLILLTPPTLILLVVGLFCGYRYSLSGKKVNYDGVNNVFDEVSKSADNMKKDFKQGYNS